MKKSEKTVAIVQARMTSSRLPGKVMREICGRSMISILLERLSRANNVDQIIVATSDTHHDDVLAQHVENLGFACYRGNLDDVLDRFCKAAKFFNADIVVRITADCPLVDPNLVDACITEFGKTEVHYLSNTINPSFPDGLDVEVFSASALAYAGDNATELFDREHVTNYIIRSNKFNNANFKHSEDLSDMRLTVDEVQDLKVVTGIVEFFIPEVHFNFLDIVNLSKNRPDLFSLNRHIGRNQGAKMGTGQKLWRRAKAVIPGGNMLLSKRPEMFLPDQWPSYFSKAKGCSVWDLDEKKYIDMSIMGVGTNILGYGNSVVDSAVAETIKNGNMSTLNCAEEVYLAEKLVELHPWADMVRFARSGGEANAIAIRIARAASNRDNVAICGYHGWHDWYLSANIENDDNLDQHLLSGLNPVGVPKGLAGTAYTFDYNDLDRLTKLVNDKNIGVIKMEVQRNQPPQDGFLQSVRELASKNNIVLIFDECTSGFRQCFGGLHKYFGVEPDMAMFGKALGNGYAITAIVGKEEVMASAQDTFISSTFWTERIGPTAALATLKEMNEIESWKIITDLGVYFRQQLTKIMTRQGLQGNIWGIPSLTGFTLEFNRPMVHKTYITQEMLKKGFLASNTIYFCVDHSRSVIDLYIEALEEVFAMIASKSEDELEGLLLGPICHSGFSRLN